MPEELLNMIPYTTSTSCTNIHVEDDDFIEDIGIRHDKDSLIKYCLKTWQPEYSEPTDDITLCYQELINEFHERVYNPTTGFNNSTFNINDRVGLIEGEGVNVYITDMIKTVLPYELYDRLTCNAIPWTDGLPSSYNTYGIRMVYYSAVTGDLNIYDEPPMDKLTREQLDNYRRLLEYITIGSIATNPNFDYVGCFDVLFICDDDWCITSYINYGYNLYPDSEHVCNYSIDTCRSILEDASSASTLEEMRSIVDKWNKYFAEEEDEEDNYSDA